MVVIRRNRFDPVRGLEDVQRAMSRLIDEGFVRSQECGEPDCGCLPLDVYMTADSFVVQANAPGAKPEDVHVTIEGDILTIKVQLPNPEAGVEYAMRERDSGEFARTLSFGVPIQPEAAEATFENGVLVLTIPKAEEIKPKTIKIKTS